MKLLLTLVLVSFLFFEGNAQVKAVTEAGDEVILYDDQTWSYVDQDSSDTEVIPLNETIFVKPDNSSFQVKSSKLASGLYLDPKAWSFKKATDNEAAEYEFSAKNKDLYGLWITEEISIPLETLGRIAVNNAREAASGLKVLNKEYRMVNGRKVLHIKMSGNIQGIDVTYHGYYFSDESGSSQVLTYTSTQLVEQYKQVMEDLLNGFSAKEE